MGSGLKTDVGFRRHDANAAQRKRELLLVVLTHELKCRSGLSAWPSCASAMPDAATPLRWGCIGTGQIAMAMAQQLSRMPDARKEARRFWGRSIV